MPEIPDVTAGETILSGEWGNPIRSRTLQRYSSAAERDTLVPVPESGDAAWLEDLGQLTIYDGTAWAVVLSEFPIRGPFGSAGVPSYSFSGDPDSGVFMAAAGDLRMAVGGGSKLAVRASEVVPGQSNAIDFGSASLYWRSVSSRRLSSVVNGTFTAPNITVGTGGAQIYNSTGTLVLGNGDNAPGLILIATEAAANPKAVYPNSTGTVDLGRTAQRWRTLYANTAVAEDVQLDQVGTDTAVSLRAELEATRATIAALEARLAAAEATISTL